MSENYDNEIIDAMEKLDGAKVDYIKTAREWAEVEKKNIDNLVDMFEKWNNDKAIWATAIRLISENVGTEFEFPLNQPGDDFDAFQTTVHCYPKEDNPEIWTVKLEVTKFKRE